MKKNELKMKLGLYSMASGAMALMTTNADAQVTYTDITPDGTLTTIGGTYMIDLNGDSNDDFYLDFADWNGGNGALYIKPVNATGNGIVGIADLPFTYRAGALAAGATISNTAPSPNIWVGSAMMAVKGAGSNYGPFANATDKYIGLRLKSGADYYYGWVRVSVSIGAPSITIKDMAFDATLNTSIATAQTTATLSQKVLDLNSKVAVNVNDLNEVNVTNNSESSVTAELVTLTGEVVGTKEISSGSMVNFTNQKLASGMAFVKLTMGDVIATKKVIIK
mgnify:CR=1 FL=1